MRLAMGELMMLGLRLVREGVEAERFRGRFGIGLDEAFASEIDGLVERGLLERAARPRPPHSRGPAAWQSGLRGIPASE